MKFNSLTMVKILLLSFVIASSAYGSETKRYRDLKKIISKNTGHAHFTRGMNLCTILALRNAVNDSDLDTLVDLLDDKDNVTAMTAGNVLNMFGEKGQKKLKSELQLAREKKDSSKQFKIEDYLGSEPPTPDRIKSAYEHNECKKGKH